MSTRRRTLATLALAAPAALSLPDPAAAAEAGPDWPNLARYRDDNLRLQSAPPARGRVVLMGDSITEGWSGAVPGLFERLGWINRGISGQTTPQMLLRLRPDVLALRPQAVAILAGTNDVAGNTGPVSDEAILGNIASMAELARAHGVRVVLCSIPPAARFGWIPQLEGAAPRIVAINQGLARYARREGFVYVDYHAALADAKQGLRPEYGGDGVHPNAAGYGVMLPLLQQGLRRALAARAARC